MDNYIQVYEINNLKIFEFSDNLEEFKKENISNILEVKYM
jgi:hypothetical protein